MSDRTIPLARLSDVQAAERGAARPARAGKTREPSRAGPSAPDPEPPRATLPLARLGPSGLLPDDA